MPERDFDMLRNQLLDSGVAPRHVIRIISELSDHHDDIEREGLENGMSQQSASAMASDRIGTQNTLAAQVICKPELRSWVYRYPRLARLVLPVAYVAMLPLAPVFAGVANAPIIARWCACLFLSGLITAAMMLVMQISIALS